MSLLDGVLLWLYLPHDAAFLVHSEVARHWLYRRLLKHVTHLAISPTNPMAIKRLPSGAPPLPAAYFTAKRTLIGALPGRLTSAATLVPGPTLKSPFA